jgi:hypothetical protein
MYMAPSVCLLPHRGLRERWASRPRRVATVLAPALPALVLLAVTTAGTVDPPSTGLVSQLHVPPTVTLTVTPR